jgi:gas vesicle protein
VGQEPRDIEQQIEETRERMGDTVEALSAKADVPGRMKGYVSDKKDAATSKLTGAKDAVAGGGSSMASTGGDMAHGATETARRGAGMAKDNPLGLAVGAVAVGFVVGTLLPSTRIENEKIGPMADQVKDQARELGSEAIEHGRDIAQETAQQAAETAKQQTREHGEQLQESVSQRT